MKRPHGSQINIGALGEPTGRSPRGSRGLRELGLCAQAGRLRAAALPERSRSAKFPVYLFLFDGAE